MVKMVDNLKAVDDKKKAKAISNIIATKAFQECSPSVVQGMMDAINDSSLSNIITTTNNYKYENNPQQKDDFY